MTKQSEDSTEIKAYVRQLKEGNCDKGYFFNKKEAIVANNGKQF